VSFATPLVLLGLLALPLALAWYVREQRRQARAAQAFVSAPLVASVAPRRAAWRRHAPYVLLALGLALLIAAAAKPQRSVAKPVRSATVVLANDVSDSMQSTDVKPSRLAAARRAAIEFAGDLPHTAQVGSIEFARHLTLLQSPTTNRALIRSALGQVKAGGGGTATGEALELALSEIKAAPKIDGKRPPGAIVLISDGASNVGPGPVEVASEARKQHVKIYTIAIGTSHGTIPFKRDGKVVTSSVPVNPTELARIASTSGGHAYTAANDATVNAIYTSLAKQLGQRHVEKSLLALAAGLGLALLAGGAALSLFWFGRVA
jgi:Ca-activated chloride channel family protein